MIEISDIFIVLIEISVSLVILQIYCIYLFWLENWRKTTKIWSKCPVLLNAKKKGVVSGDLDECKTLCKARNGCTAFNFNPKESKCLLRQCDLPVPDPDSSSTDYVGYHLSPGINS